MGFWYEQFNLASDIYYEFHLTPTSWKLSFLLLDFHKFGIFPNETDPDNSNESPFLFILLLQLTLQDIPQTYLSRVLTDEAFNSM